MFFLTFKDSSKYLISVDSWTLSCQADQLYLLGKKLLWLKVHFSCQCFASSDFHNHLQLETLCLVLRFVKVLSKATFCLLVKAVIGRLKIMFFSSGRITSEETSASEIRTTESYTHSHRKLTLWNDQFFVESSFIIHCSHIIFLSFW